MYLQRALHCIIQADGLLDKQETTSYNDIFDAFRLALRYYKINQSQNETAGFVRINETSGEKDYPPVPFFQKAQYLSERGFVVLRYDKRGVGENHTILDANVWGNLTIFRNYRI